MTSASPRSAARFIARAITSGPGGLARLDRGHQRGPEGDRSLRRRVGPPLEEEPNQLEVARCGGLAQRRPEVDPPVRLGPVLQEDADHLGPAGADRLLERPTLA